MAAGDVVSGDRTNQQQAFKQVTTKTGQVASALLVAMAEGSGSGVTELATSIGYMQLTDTQLATPYRIPINLIPSGANRVVIESNAIQAVRWRDDGPDPTVLTGRRITRDRTLDYRGNLTAIVLMAEGAGAVLDMTFYG